MATPTSVDNYLAAVPEEQRAALEQLRQTIKAAAPEASEAISYQMPAFRYNDQFLVSYGAYKHHLSLFPMSKKLMEEDPAAWKPYFSGRGTIRFSPDKPLPAEMVKQLVKERIEEIEAR